jgi:hypothetical protein
MDDENKPKKKTVSLINEYNIRGKDLQYCEERFDPEGSIDDVISRLQEIKDQYSRKYIDLQISLESGYYDERDYYCVLGVRYETPEEVATRIASEKLAKFKREEKELAEFERLSKKFKKE